MAAADAVIAAQSEIIEANKLDLVYGRDKGLSDAMLDRLMLDPARIKAMAEGLRAVAQQEDPVGRILEEWERPNGLSIQKVATPLGVIGVIYESRPNVTADAGALCLKSGNAVILRGGSESHHRHRGDPYVFGPRFGCRLGCLKRQYKPYPRAIGRRWRLY